MNTNSCIKTRKSHVAFLADRLKENDIKTVINAAAYAPRFGNIHFTVIENKDFIGQINNTTLEMMKASGDDFAMKMANTPGYSPIYNAPVVIVLSAENGNDSNGFNMVNVACAAENMLLSATELGLASRFVMAPVMAFMNLELAKTAQIPEGYAPLAIVLLGKTIEAFVEREKTSDNVNFIR